jgi:hypothetical protein
VTSFTLVRADTDADVAPLNNGDVIDLSVVGSLLNVRAVTAGAVMSVEFGLDGNASYRTENFADWMLGANNGSNHFAVPQLSQTGSHTVSATPYSEKNRSGTMGDTASITFTIVDSS